MKVNFYLEPSKTNKDGTVPIRVYVRFHNQTHRIYLGRTIHPDHWDSKAGSAREGKKYPLGSLLNQVLEKTRSDLKSAELKLEILGTPLTFENLLKQAWPDKVVEKKADTDPTIDVVIDRVASVRGGRKDSTMGKYTSLKFNLNKFRPGLRASDVKNYGKTIGLSVDLREHKGNIFAEQFTQYLQTNEYADSTIFYYLNTLREIYHEIGLEKDTKALDYVSRVADKVTLKAEQFRKIVDANVTGLYEKYRDSFVLLTLLGLRWSDYQKLKPMHFDDYEIKGYGVVKVMRLYMRKTTVPILIPVHPVGVEILEKYGYNIIKATPKGALGWYQSLCQHVGLTDDVVSTSFKGNEIKSVHTPLNELVTPHTARRTCGQLLREFTGQKDVASYILGHKERGSTAIYTSENPERVIPIILDAWDKIITPKVTETEDWEERYK